MVLFILPYLSHRKRELKKPVCVVLEKLAGNFFAVTSTTDNWFTNIGLVQQLKEKKLSYVGTLKRNKRQLPSELVVPKGMKELSSMLGSQKDIMLVSYFPNPKKSVILVSTLHVDKKIDPDPGEQQKPFNITFCNATKNSVDTAHQYVCYIQYSSKY